MTKKNLTKALLWLLCALIFTPSVRASSLYGVEFSTGTGFYRVNQSTGAISLLGNTGNSFTGDLASDLVSTIWTPDMNADTLLTINPANGAITSTTNLRTAAGAPVNIVSLAWNPVTHTLWGNSAVGFGGTSNDALYQINPTTGLTTLVGTNIGFNQVYALGFDNSGKLYGISQSSNDLITINTATGAGSLVAAVGLFDAFDLAFRPEDNSMFVADSGTSSLYTMNPTTGTATLVGPYGSSKNVVGLAFLAPEPGTILLLAAGLGSLGLLGRRARKRT